jgi:trehalose 6-phosphate phosphatase
MEAWRRSGRLVLLLDFDGTLAPIVERPEIAAMPEATAAALRRLAGCDGVELAVISGRGLADARERVALPGVAYAGNHGMEIERGELRQVHDVATAARPELDAVIGALHEPLRRIPGVLVEDKGLTLSVHSRRVAREDVDRLRRAVEEATRGRAGLRVTEGKEVLEIRPAVDWHKGRAVEFLLERIDPPAGAPVLYFGDDRTDEDAFRALRAWERGPAAGVIVAEAPPPETEALAWLAGPEEVGEVLERMAREGPC